MIYGSSLSTFSLALDKCCLVNNTTGCGLGEALSWGACGESGNPLGRETSVIQFDVISAMAVLSLHSGSGEGSTEEQWIPLALL